MKNQENGGALLGLLLLVALSAAAIAVAAVLSRSSNDCRYRPDTTIGITVPVETQNHAAALYGTQKKGGTAAIAAAPPFFAPFPLISQRAGGIIFL